MQDSLSVALERVEYVSVLCIPQLKNRNKQETSEGELKHQTAFTSNLVGGGTTGTFSAMIM
jgi:hypothetical protein